MELFETTGQVELAEILFEGTRSKGCGVVQFAQVAEAETAIGKIDPHMLKPSTNATARSQIPAVHVRRSSPGRTVQRPMAHVHPGRGERRSNGSHAGGCLSTCEFIFASSAVRMRPLEQLPRSTKYNATSQYMLSQAK